MAMNQSCYALRPKNGLGKLFLFMVTKDCTEQLQQKATGAVFDAITVDTFDRLRIIRPPNGLTQEYEAAVRPMFAMMLNLDKKNHNLRTTRNLLLPKLVSGEVSVEQIEQEVVAEMA
jgi:type I restriction enzyme S subunit